MRRSALAVLLSLCIPVLLFGQRGSREGGSSSGSSGSSSSSGGYSGGSSGGYSGGSSGSYHSSSSSSSSSSGSSSSSSSSSSGSSRSSSSSSGSPSSSGNSRSSSGEPSYTRSGSGSGSGSRPGSGGSVGTHSTTGNSTPRSNLRSGNTDSSGATSGSGSSRSGTGSQVYSGNSRDPWLQQPVIDAPVQIHLQNALPRSDLDKARQEGKLNADSIKMGLEPNQQAYQQKMADLQAVENLSSQKPQSRLSKFLFGDREKSRLPQPDAQASLRRCVLKECGPTPPPCVGKNCRPLPPCQGANCAPHPPAPPVVDTGCAYSLTAGAQGHSYCQPLGYVDHCDGNGICYAHLGQVNGSYCDTILDQLKRQKKQAESLLKTQQTACSTNAQSADCTSATNAYQAFQTQLQQLAAQYQMCRAAAGLGPANINMGPSGVIAPPSTP